MVQTHDAIARGRRTMLSEQSADVAVTRCVNGLPDTRKSIFLHPLKNEVDFRFDLLIRR